MAHCKEGAAAWKSNHDHERVETRRLLLQSILDDLTSGFDSATWTESAGIHWVHKAMIGYHYLKCNCKSMELGIVLINLTLEISLQREVEKSSSDCGRLFLLSSQTMRSCSLRSVGNKTWKPTFFTFSSSFNILDIGNNHLKNSQCKQPNTYFIKVS